MPKGDGPLPLLIWIHRGGARRTDSASCGAGLRHCLDQLSVHERARPRNRRFQGRGPLPPARTRRNTSWMRIESGPGRRALGTLLGTSDSIEKNMEPEGTKPGECTASQRVVRFLWPRGPDKNSPRPVRPKTRWSNFLGGTAVKRKHCAKAGTAANARGQIGPALSHRPRRHGPARPPFRRAKN